MKEAIAIDEECRKKAEELVRFSASTFYEGAYWRLREMSAECRRGIGLPEIAINFPYESFENYSSVKFHAQWIECRDAVKQWAIDNEKQLIQDAPAETNPISTRNKEGVETLQSDSRSGFRDFIGKIRTALA